MFRSFCLLVVFVCLTTFVLPTKVWAQAKGVVISAGNVGGYYDAVATRMRVVFNSQYNIAVEVQHSQGSIENLYRLDDDTLQFNLAFTQADALAHYLYQHPDFESQYVVLDELGRECAFLIAPTAGKVKKASDLHAPGERTVSVGEPMSGSAITWEHLNRIDPRFHASPAINVRIIEALLDLRSKRPRRNLAAALVVQRALAASAPVEIVLDNPEVYRFVPITKSDFNANAKEMSRAGYSFDNITVGFGRDYEQKFETICTDGLILAATEKLGEVMLMNVTKALFESRSYILPGSKKK